MFRRTTMFVIAVAVLILAMTVPVAAKRGGNGGGNGGGNKPPKDDASIVLDQQAPSYGDTVTFSISQTTTDRPFVHLQCYKSGRLVYDSTVGMFQEWYDEWGEPDFVLASLAWNGGNADCTSTLYYQNRRYRTIELASMRFGVTG